MSGRWINRINQSVDHHGRHFRAARARGRFVNDHHSNCFAIQTRRVNRPRRGTQCDKRYRYDSTVQAHLSSEKAETTTEFCYKNNHNDNTVKIVQQDSSIKKKGNNTTVYRLRHVTFVSYNQLFVIIRCAPTVIETCQCRGMHHHKLYTHQCASPNHELNPLPTDLVASSTRESVSFLLETTPSTSSFISKRPKYTMRKQKKK